MKKILKEKRIFPLRVEISNIVRFILGKDERVWHGIPNQLSTKYLQKTILWTMFPSMSRSKKQVKTIAVSARFTKKNLPPFTSAGKNNCIIALAAVQAEI